MHRFSSAVLLFCSVAVMGGGVSAQTLAARPAETAAAPQGAAHSPNANATYQQLRNITLGDESVAVHELVLQRDAGIFKFHSGSISFLPPVNGKVTGAVFNGEGTFTLVPPVDNEKHNLSILTGGPGMTEEFGDGVFRFTDATYAEIKKTGSASHGSINGRAQAQLSAAKDALRHKLHENLDGRILQDVLSPEPGGLFVALINGRKYGSKLAYWIDPHGVDVGSLQPEEVALLNYDENKFGIWAGFHFSPEYARPGGTVGSEDNSSFSIASQDLDTQIEKSGKLNGNAVTTVVARSKGVTVLPLMLFRTLRAQSVSNAQGEQLDFIQENKDQDPDFSVVLPKPLQVGEKYVIRTIYSGKDAVQNEGGGNYFPVAREDWYPSLPFGHYAIYHMIFRIPKNLQMVATGVPGKSVTEGDQNISEWNSEAPMAVAGFNFGKFRRSDAQSGAYQIAAYANENPPDFLQGLVGVGALGTMNTTGMMKKPLAEAQIAMQLYTDYFGPSSYKRISMTQQTACTFGQSWPSMVYIPICAFFDATVRHGLGLDDVRGYWQVVGPHEVAHQWWGHTVGFNSYRDQWMSEGFAELSASLFLQQVYAGKPQVFQKFWSDQLELLTEKNRQGFRSIDAGPVTMGYRLNNSKMGSVTQRLIYPKGAFILHMVRMLMWDKNGDDNFKAMMHDFVKTYADRAASTEDFKLMVEKHMTDTMDLTENHKMDWFFNEYVYGTALPAYKLDYSFENGSGGTMVLSVTATQSNVSDNFRMRVPLYLELANGKIMRLGAADMVGNKSITNKIPLNGLKDRPKRVMLNYFYDVLASK